ncbi:MAG: Zn-ribbon domain-containing OB-fold protein [Methanosarcina thermophila]|jgi:uncharacterized OB-fold protein|uniref:Protein associated with acetyl-CoA C-acyltransferase n=1 Tax=Methanosarcina thermophila TaxID=2210 RepID=A0A1I6XAG4_METTE|nr:Zn-ribbon domain-containing OB-fold protein [Methanosarcina thermophila]ALK04584.1 MAG: AcaC [Methanosarcina sp. 795]NLU57207.1 Zn-ribbon domain-containing OB-fold protein [Methanosarcina thermophila]SFT34784.1 hypothetical protein SAMN02910340_00323 [Methanosarcina thermophila]BAW28240.1 protein associated with acetyl-CoA C-acyltransferase [Methanosarcina thermophila]GLI13076.1 transcriptional regulator [Methanosarcina thermophila MST-A1]
MSSVPRFWRNLGSRYNLEGTRCSECGEYFYPPRNVCVNCRRGGEIEPYTFKGTGEIVTYTFIHTAAEGFEIQAPYTLAIIQLDEGPRLTSQVVGDPEKIHIGMRVRSVFRKLGEDGKRGMIYYGTKFTPIDE